MNKKTAIDPLKTDLEEINKDWSSLFDPSHTLNDPQFLSKFARDILNLDQDALSAMKCSEVKEHAELVHFLLSTPWGAPFVGETTLLDAARTYAQNNQDGTLLHLIHRFVHHAAAQNTPLFNVFDSISEQINKL